MYISKEIVVAQSMRGDGGWEGGREGVVVLEVDRNEIFSVPKATVTGGGRIDLA